MRTSNEIRKDIDVLEGNLDLLRNEWRQSHAKEEAEAKQTCVTEYGRLNACNSYFRPDGTCAYCGSITIIKAIELLSTPGKEFSGADWKYGWPHKFYLDSTLKFYNAHLTDATEDEFKLFALLSSRMLSVAWDKDSKGHITWRAVPNTQRYGHVPEAVVQ